MKLDNLTNGELLDIARKENDSFSEAVSKSIMATISKESLILESDILFINNNAEINQTSYCISEVASKVLQDNFDICDDGTYIQEIVITACSSAATNAATLAVRAMAEKYKLNISKSELNDMVSDCTFEVIPK